MNGVTTYGSQMNLAKALWSSLFKSSKAPWNVDAKGGVQSKKQSFGFRIFTFSIFSANGLNHTFRNSQNMRRERERETDIQSDSGYHNPCLPPLHTVHPASSVIPSYLLPVLIINSNGSSMHMLQAFRGATNSSGHFSKTTT